MKIIQKVAIKEIVTDQSKQGLRDQYQFKILKMEQECEQLRFEQKKLEHQSSNKKPDIALKFQKEMANRKDHIKWYKYKLEQLDIMPLGNEIKKGEVETLVEIEEGMEWSAFTEDKAIVIQDGVITKIR